jgi:hypothetical protein
MFTPGHGLPGQGLPEHGLHETDEPKFDKLEMSEAQIRSASFICALLIAGCAAIGIVLLANSDQPQGSLEISDCAHISLKADRLDCFDAVTSRPVAEPAKGVNAPALHDDP